MVDGGDKKANKVGYDKVVDGVGGGKDLNDVEMSNNGVDDGKNKVN